MAQDRTNSMIQRILSEKGTRIEFLTVQNEEGKDFFAYLFVSEADYPAYLEARDSGSINPDEHGIVFAYGEGKVPSEELKKMVEELLES